MTKLLLWILTGVAVMAAAAGGTACQEDEQAASPSATTAAVTTTATPGNGPGDGGGGDAEPTIVPVVTPGPRAASIPSNWPEFRDDGGVFVIRHPTDFHVDSTGRSLVVLLNWNPEATTKPGFPPGGSKLDVIVTTRDLMEQQPAGAVAVGVGGLYGWQVSKAYDAASGIGLSRMHQVVLYRGDIAASIVQMWADESPDETDFWRVVNSFTLLSGAATSGRTGEVLTA